METQTKDNDRHESRPPDSAPVFFVRETVSDLRPRFADAREGGQDFQENEVKVTVSNFSPLGKLDDSLIT